MDKNQIYDILSNLKENSFENKFYLDINNLYKELNKIKNNNILKQGFIDKHIDELRKIKNFLLERKDKRSRSIHDKIFTDILKMDKYIPLGITQVFEDFVKGITYFSNEIENKNKIPIYHRAASCGNSSEDFKKKYLQCYKDNNELTLKIKRDHIFKCYLERLIYDKIYLNSILHFPSGLNNELRQRAKNFNECFLGLNIEIEIFYELELPSYLIIKYIKDGNIEKIEEYSKIVYIDSFGVKRYSDKTILKIIKEDGKPNNIGQFFDITKNNILNK